VDWKGRTRLKNQESRIKKKKSEGLRVVGLLDR
jgi:hypothetical protein